MLGFWGVKDETYVANGKVLKFAPNIKAEYNPNGTIDGGSDLGIHYNGLIGINPDFYGWSEFTDENLYSSKVNKVYAGNGVIIKRNLVLNDDEKDIQADYKGPIRDLIETEITKFVMGERPMSEWDAFVKKVKDSGADKLLDAYNKAYARQTK